MRFPCSFLAGSLILGLGLLGCNSSSSDDSDEEGEVVIGLTDAEGDFAQYAVNVTSLVLERRNGTLVETLPATTTVDFAQYTELTEFLTAATVPSGTYISASLMLDYTEAQILVEDASGDFLPADAYDEDGELISEIALAVEFSSQSPLLVAPGIPAHITLDFDLEASHTVDFDQSPPQVKVEPILIADTILDSPKEHRLRGLLRGVDLENDRFFVGIRPFQRLSGEFGRLGVQVSADTQYEIDGVPYAGDDGLVAMDDLLPTTPVITLGQLEFNPIRFVAVEVLAGSSVPWGDLDLVSGNVVSRSGDLVTVRGATVVRKDGSVIFHDDVTVTMGRDIILTRQGRDDGTLTIDDISVGSHIAFAGTLTDPDALELELDASMGFARLLLTQMAGTVVQVSPLVMDLQSIQGRRPAIFDFTGTGDSEDADPNEYEIDTGSLNLDSLRIGDPVRIRGFVQEFGEAPEDFVAQTVIDPSDIVGSLLVNWQGRGTEAPFSQQSELGFVLDLQNPELGLLHHVVRAGISVDLTDLSQNASIQQERDSGRGVYTVVQNRRVRVYSDFATFAGAIISQLDGTTRFDDIFARGRFDDAQATFSARGMIIKLR